MLDKNFSVLEIFLACATLFFIYQFIRRDGLKTPQEDRHIYKSSKREDALSAVTVLVLFVAATVLLGAIGSDFFFSLFMLVFWTGSLVLQIWLLQQIRKGKQSYSDALGALFGSLVISLFGGVFLFFLIEPFVAGVELATMIWAYPAILNGCLLILFVLRSPWK